MLQKYPLILALAACTALALIYHFNHQAPQTTLEDVISIGTNAEYQPYCFVKDGTITGLDIELIEELSKRLHKKIIIKDMAFTTLLPELQLGSIHVIAAGLTPTEERGRVVNFLTPHQHEGALVIIAPKTAAIGSLDDLRGKTVITNEGFTADTYISAIKDINVLRVPSVADAFLTLQNNRADAFVSALSAAQPFFALYGKDNWTIITLPTSNDATALAISKKYPALQQALQEQLNAMKADGSLAALTKKWGLN